MIMYRGEEPVPKQAPNAKFGAWPEPAQDQRICFRPDQYRIKEKAYVHFELPEQSKKF